jgi:hypothetical protein
MHKLQTAAFEDVVAWLVLATEAREYRIPAAAEGLHVCSACGSRLVYPTWWEEAGDDPWQVRLRCPGCEWVGGGRFEPKLVDELERELDRGDAELEADLALLTRANMVDEIDRFVRALDADAIQPFDF